MKFKKILLTLAFTVFIASGVSASSQGIKVIMDGRRLNSDVTPVIINERTMVPIRVIFEAIGGQVEWDNNTQTARAIKDNDIIKLQIGNKKANINGEEFLLDVPATFINSRTLVPVRFISREFRMWHLLG